MDLKSFESHVRTENTARRYLSNRGYTFHDFTGRWLNELRISCRQWLWLIKLFDLELSAKKITEQIDLMSPILVASAKAKEAEELLTKFRYSVFWSETALLKLKLSKTSLLKPC